jgi:hypothetical protein
MAFQAMAVVLSFVAVLLTALFSPAESFAPLLIVLVVGLAVGRTIGGLSAAGTLSGTKSS